MTTTNTAPDVWFGLTRMERDLVRWADAAGGFLFLKTITDPAYDEAAHRLTYYSPLRLFRFDLPGGDWAAAYIELTPVGREFASKIRRREEAQAA